VLAIKSRAWRGLEDAQVQECLVKNGRGRLTDHSAFVRGQAPHFRPLANGLNLARTSGTTSSCNARTRGAAYETILRLPLPPSSQSFLCHISPRHALSTSSAHGLAPSPVRTPTTTVHFHSSILHRKMPPSRRKHRRP